MERPVLVPAIDAVDRSRLEEGLGAPPYWLYLPIRNAGSGPALDVVSAVDPSQPHRATGVLAVGDEVFLDIPVFRDPARGETFKHHSITVHIDCTDIGSAPFTTELYLFFGDDPPASLELFGVGGRRVVHRSLPHPASHHDAHAATGAASIQAAKRSIEALPQAWGADAAPQAAAGRSLARGLPGQAAELPSASAHGHPCKTGVAPSVRGRTDGWADHAASSPVATMDRCQGEHVPQTPDRLLAPRRELDGVRAGRSRRPPTKRRYREPKKADHQDEAAVRDDDALSERV